MSELHKFLFEGMPVRGMLVRLTDSWQELLRRREKSNTPLPGQVRVLMGEMAAAAVLMQSNINFNGVLVLQLQGDGPVKLAVAEVQPDLAFRVTATVVGDVPEQGGLQTLVNARGKSQCLITLDPKSRLPGQQPYQGVVGLQGDQGEPLQNLSDVLEHYMRQSAQLDTRLILAANDDVAAGLLIQRLPTEGVGNLAHSGNEDDSGMNEAYNRIAHLASTLTTQELLTCDANTVLRRLFWEETVRCFEPLGPRFACTCSRQRVANMLTSLGSAEVSSIIEEQAGVVITCEFCGMPYRFDPIEAGELFVPGRDQPPSSSAVN